MEEPNKKYIESIKDKIKSVTRKNYDNGYLPFDITDRIENEDQIIEMMQDLLKIIDNLEKRIVELEKK